jgi:hypothetical protein
MNTRLMALSPAQRAEAVRAFDALYGEMERALWCLSVNCRSALIDGQSTPVVEALVWTVKSWWGVQGAPSETKTVMAQALAELDWSEELFAPTSVIADNAARDACVRVAELVARTKELGLSRREYSLASKVLHWLLPWRVPVYDSFVRASVGVPTGWDHPQAYRRIAQDVFAAVERLVGDDTAWLGSVEPASPLRALDKCLWWVGGGNEGRAALVKNPSQVVFRLGLTKKD